MAKKLFILFAGTFMLAPIVIALCSNDLIVVSCAVLYFFIVWNSPKFSVGMRKFWLEFWKINMRLLSMME